MNRRSFIAASIGAALLPGCTTTGSNGEPQTASTQSSESSTTADQNRVNNRITIAVSKRRVSPGDTGTITVIAKDVEEMQAQPAVKPIIIEYEAASFSPRVDRVADSMPPIWGWSSPQPEVTAKLPFRVSPDAQSGPYNRTIAIWNGPPSYTESVSKEFTITVENGASPSSSASVETSASTTEETQSTTVCFETPYTRGTAIYEGTRVPCDDTAQTAETQTQ